MKDRNVLVVDPTVEDNTVHDFHHLIHFGVVLVHRRRLNAQFLDLRLRWHDPGQQTSLSVGDWGEVRPLNWLSFAVRAVASGEGRGIGMIEVESCEKPPARVEQTNRPP